MTDLLDIFEEVIEDEEQFKILKQIDEGKSPEEIIEEEIGFEE